MCHRTDLRMNVIECRFDIVRHNQEIIHSQRDEPLIEFLDELIYPYVPDPYASLTPTELAAFGIGPSHVPTTSDDDDDGDEEAANDDEETEDDE
jgi:hypothetical protein